MKKIILILCCVLCLVFISGCGKNQINKKKHRTSNVENNHSNIVEEEDKIEMITDKIKITINNETFLATLEDNETARELIKRLPLHITMSELNGNEKYYYFDESLPSNSKKIERINTGDIMLYGNDCLVLFYDTFVTNYTYTKIGKLENSTNLKSIVGNENIEIDISK